MTLPEMALRFILSHPAVSTTIAGMRKPEHVRQNIATSDAGPLDKNLAGRVKEASLGPHAAALVGLKRRPTQLPYVERSAYTLRALVVSRRTKLPSRLSRRFHAASARAASTLLS